MRAMIFAAGLGTRLAPLTDTCPKALIEVGGLTMLERAVGLAVRAGASGVTVNIHHHAPLVRRYIDTHPWPVGVTVSDESDALLDTGGGVAKARGLLCDGPVLLLNADIYTTLDLRPMVDAHLRSGADATLLTSGRDSARRLLFDAGGRMCGWTNTLTGEVRTPLSHGVPGNAQALAFGGIHVVSERLLDDLAAYAPAGSKFSITPYYTDRCGLLDIRCYTPAQAYDWVDIGRPETLARARALAEGT